MLPPVKVELTLEQQFQVQKFTKIISELPRAELENYFIHLFRQKCSIQNAFKNLILNYDKGI